MKVCKEQRLSVHGVNPFAIKILQLVRASFASSSLFLFIRDIFRIMDFVSVIILDLLLCSRIFHPITHDIITMEKPEMYLGTVKSDKTLDWTANHAGLCPGRHCRRSWRA